MAPPPSSLIRAISYQPRSAAEVADLDGSSAGTASAQDHPSRSHHHHHHVASATASSPRRQLTLDPLSTTRSRARSVSSSNLRDSNSNIVVGDAPSATSGSVGVTAQGAREPRDVRTPDFVLGDPQQQQQAQRLHALGLGSSPARPSASASAFRPTPAQGLTSSVMDIIADGGRTNQAGPSRQRSLSGECHTVCCGKEVRRGLLAATGDTHICASGSSICAECQFSSSIYAGHMLIAHLQ